MQRIDHARPMIDRLRRLPSSAAAPCFKSAGSSNDQSANAPKPARPAEKGPALDRFDLSREQGVHWLISIA